MYVRPECRGQGVARAVLALLETQAAQAGCTLVQLETGPYQPEALALYARSGYQRCGPFGGYWDDPLSVFMQKQIGGGATPLEWSESTDGLDCDLAPGKWSS
jgi:putative acetyltransferase